MAWDFETEPEFEKKLAWMREFMKEEVFPLETLLQSSEALRVGLFTTRSLHRLKNK